MRIPTMAAFVAALAILPCASHAQKEPKRPKLPAQADTNDAHVYYDYAMEQLRIGEHDRAADALYWSTRLEPNYAEAFYARRIALLLTDPRRLTRYWSGEKSTTQSNDIRKIDSLFYYALTINPFVPQRLERLLYEGVLEEITRRYERAGYQASEVRYALDREVMSWPVADRAWFAYGDGRYTEALALYAQAIKSDKRYGPLHLDRGRIFASMGESDSALAELTAAVTDLHQRDKKDLVYVYQSKALAEHSIAVIHQRLGHEDAAREAYGRALQEDLSFYPAHVQLAFMSLEKKDTTAALSEMELALQLRDDDAATHYVFGFTLGAVGRSTDAEVQLRKAIQLNPIYAAPHFVLAQTLEKLHKTPDAMAEYRTFLALAAKGDLRRDEAQARIGALGASGQETTR